MAGEAAAEAAGAARRVDSALGRSGPAPWGDDPGLGQSFESVFARPREALVQDLEKVPEVLRDLADRLQESSRTFADVENENESIAAARWLAERIRREAV